VAHENLKCPTNSREKYPGSPQVIVLHKGTGPKRPPNLPPSTGTGEKQPTQSSQAGKKQGPLVFFPMGIPFGPPKPEKKLERQKGKHPGRKKQGVPIRTGCREEKGTKCNKKT